MAFLLNSQAQGVSGKNEQSSQTPWRGAQRSCIGCIGLSPALIPQQGILNQTLKQNFLPPRHLASESFAFTVKQSFEKTYFQCFHLLQFVFWFVIISVLRFFAFSALLWSSIV